MITRHKIEGGLMNWQVVMISVAFVLFLAATVILVYWYLFGSGNLFKKSATSSSANPNVFIYQKHSLTNVMIEGILKGK